ncbi:MAG: cob(I)yrinic acid a,c-diamide adenosyltransferase [Armatimonadetes bacterium RBG_16_58_9]|nr:MAG: cob(I)yrinic acid a,c-diamide adenosyltransferase [Armatimonadetes bacterium RBG_16_58_9]
MNRWRIDKGLIHVYTGAGKGKTTAALGLALRALGWGARVCVVQFIKGYADIGEARFAGAFGERFVLRQFASDNARVISEHDVRARRREAHDAMEFAEGAVGGGEYDVVILDEINNALHYGLLDMSRVLAMLKNRPKRVEVVLTGRNAPPDIIEAADYVTEMRPVKHPHKRGVNAREGVDY